MNFTSSPTVIDPSMTRHPPARRIASSESPPAVSMSTIRTARRFASSTLRSAQWREIRREALLFVLLAAEGLDDARSGERLLRAARQRRLLLLDAERESVDLREERPQEEEDRGQRDHRGGRDQRGDPHHEDRGAEGPEARVGDVHHAGPDAHPDRFDVAREARHQVSGARPVEERPGERRDVGEQALADAELEVPADPHEQVSHPELADRRQEAGAEQPAELVEHGCRSGALEDEVDRVAGQVRDEQHEPGPAEQREEPEGEPHAFPADRRDEIGIGEELHGGRGGVIQAGRGPDRKTDSPRRAR